MYVVVPFAVHVGLTVTADEISAVAVSVHSVEFAHVLVAVHALPSAAKLYETVQSCPVAETIVSTLLSSLLHTEQ